MRLALAKQRANEKFLIRHTFKGQFSYFKIYVMPPRQNHSNHPNSNQNKHGQNYVKKKSFDNVVDYITNNEYEN